MRSADLLAFAFASLVRQRRRGFMGLLGVTIGVASVVLLTAVGEGARRYVVGQFGALGANLLIVVPGKSETAGDFPGGSPAPRDLTLEDALALSREVTALRRVVPVHLANETISHRELRRQAPVLGSTAELLAVRELRLADGSFLPAQRGAREAERASPVVVLGAKLARELFPEASPVGANVRIGSWRMRVIGVLEPKGTQMALDLDDLVIVPVASALQMFNRSSLSEILIEAAPGVDSETARRRVVEVLAERHREEDFTCVTQGSVIRSLSRILTALTAAVGGIAAVSLGVAGIVVMNLMLVSVSERTGEVGLLKALGATRRQILALLLVEALLLVAVGAVLGLGIGWALVRLLVLVYPALPASPPLWAVVAVFFTALACGAVFGALPARRATRLDPVAALARG
jgi:putative ABC transport system permease protein